MWIATNERDPATLPKLKHLAILGLGSIGRRHLRMLKAMRPDISVTLVRSGKGQPWPEEMLASQVVSSITSALDARIDAAIISSPAPFHVPQAMQLLVANIPVLIEKPISNTFTGIDELQRIVSQRQSIVLVGYVLRYAPAARRFQELLSDGRLGSLLFGQIECGSYLPDWRPEQDYRTTTSASAALGGGVLLELSHDLDYANWFFGPFSSVAAILRNSGTLGLPVEDTADLLLTGVGGLPVSIHLDFCRRHQTRQCKVYGEHGSLCWDAIRNQVFWESIGAEQEVWEFPVDQDEMFRLQLAHFIACIEQGDQPCVTLGDGIAALRIVEAAHTAGRERRVALL